VFDDRRPDESPNAERYGAFVTAGHDDGTVEVARRLFPVPDDLEGVAASTLPTGATAEGREIVLHNAANVSRQSLLCSDPYDLPPG
jgi:hypothetical protein